MAVRAEPDEIADLAKEENDRSSDPILGVTFRQLQAFVAIADNGTFAAASEKLGISQPTISRHIKSIESKCGPLFIRNSGGRVLLSVAGQLLHKRAPALLHEIHEIGREIAGAEKARSFIKIASGEYIGDLIKDVIAEFNFENPYYFVEAQIVGSEEEGRRLIALDEVDLFYHPHVGAPDLLNSQILAQVEVGPFAVPELAQELNEHEGKSWPIILPQKNSAGEQFIHQLLGEERMETARVVARAQYMQTSKTLCLRGVGVALLFNELVKDELAAGKLVKLDWDMRPTYRCCYMNPRHSKHPGVRRFLDYSRRLLS